MDTIDSFQRHQIPFSRSQRLVFNSSLVLNPVNMLLLVVLDVEINPEIPQKQSKTVPRGNGPVPRHDEFGSGKPSMVNLHRMLEENFDRQLSKMRNHFVRQDKKLDELSEKMRTTNQRLVDLQH